MEDHWVSPTALRFPSTPWFESQIRPKHTKCLSLKLEWRGWVLSGFDLGEFVTLQDLERFPVFSLLNWDAG